MVRASGLRNDSVFRALAHPARAMILQHLISEGPSTATECAPITGLSPSACSFHLRELAKFGLVERVPGSHPQERRRLWQACQRDLELSETASSDTSSDGDSPTVWELLQTQRQQDVHRYLSRKQSYPPEWQRAAGRDELVLTVTAEELTHLRWTIRQLLRSLTASRPDLPQDSGTVLVAVDYTPMFNPRVQEPDDTHHD